MRRSLIGISMIVLVSFTLLFTSCKNDDDSNGTSVSTNNGSFRIAYINRDSLAGEYEFYNDIQTSFMLDQQEKEAELNARYKSLQTKYIKVQRDVQNRMITPTSAQQKQEQLALDQQKLQQDQQRYELEVMEKSQKLTLEILDSIKNYVEVYNKEHNFNMILNNDTLGSIVIYADDKMNITEDIVKGLNKRYRAAIDKGEETTEENK